MGKKGGQKQRVTEYQMSGHVGFCIGPTDRFCGLYYDETLVSEGDPDDPNDPNARVSLIDLEVQGFEDIDVPKFSGGPQKEGGLRGRVWYLPGNDNQLLDAELATKYGKTPTTVVGYRGVTSLFFTETPTIPVLGFNWGANSPYIKTVWAGFTRCPKGWYEEKACIPRSDTQSVLAEVARGEYALDTGLKVNQTTYDFTAAVREYYTIQNMTSPVKDILHVWDMKDHSLKESIDIEWEGVVSNAANMSLFDDRHKWLVVTTTNAGARVVDRADGTMLSVNGGPNLGATNAANLMFIDGVLHLVNYGFSGISNWKYEVWKFDGTTWSEVTAPHVSVNSSGAIFAGIQEQIGQSTFYWNRVSDDAVMQTVVTTAGVVTTTVLWTPPFGYSDILYDHNDGGMVFRRSSTHLTKYKVDDMSFLEMWDNPSAVSSNLINFPHRSSSKWTDRIVMASNIGPTTQDVINLRTGIQEDTQLHGIWDHTNGRLVWDDLGGSLWHSNNNTEMNRLQFSPLPVGGKMDANPVHVIVECLTNRVWGMGGSLLQLDLASFTAAADTIWNENFGVSILWVEQATIEDFVREILDHIEAALFVNPRTGLFQIKLIRNDYDPNTLKVFDSSNSKLIDYQIKLPGETQNEIVVTWTNPETTEEETVTLQDLGNIAIQNGEIISENRNYHGIARLALAFEVAQRDLKSVATPLATAEIETDISAWEDMPAFPVKLNFPEFNINNVIMRIGPVDHGGPRPDNIKMQLTQDIFTEPDFNFAEPPSSGWTNPIVNPLPAENIELTGMPYYLANQILDQSIFDPSTYPDTFTGILASTTQAEAINYDLGADVTDPLGVTQFTILGERDFLARTGLLTAMVQETQTLMALADFNTFSKGPGLQRLAIAIINPAGAPDDNSEWCVVSDFTDPNYTFLRGCFDTTPKDWPVGTPVWVLTDVSLIHDNTVRADTDSPMYKVLPTTNGGTLSAEAIGYYQEVISGRPHYPSRPRNVRVEGQRYGIVDAIGIDPFDVEWSRSNRITEDNQILDWEAADVPPEAGQETQIVIMDMARNVLNTAPALAGTSTTIAHALASGESEILVRVESTRDSLTSLQGHELHVILDSGWGQNYGFNYGG